MIRIQAGPGVPNLDCITLAMYGNVMKYVVCSDFMCDIICVPIVDIFIGIILLTAFPHVQRSQHSLPFYSIPFCSTELLILSYLRAPPQPTKCTKTASTCTETTPPHISQLTPNTPHTPQPPLPLTPII